jgi:hydroxyacylglutathione hydrolase
MKVEQIYTSCLSHGAYYIESGGEVAIIDPLREVDPYIKKADRDNAKIKYVLETHFHADFVSGHIDLAKRTGAEIVFGPNANPDFAIYKATDGEILELGNVKIKVIHTPGHTMESSCFLLFDEKGKDHSIFTGDTLFIGDVGRPDLAQSGSVTTDDLAGILFDSLREKIMSLPDDLILYPGHGAGSSCGKKMSEETVSTIGLQKKINYALRENMTRDEFIKEVTDGLLAPPPYFPKNAKINKTGYKNIHHVIEKGTRNLGLGEFISIIEEDDVLVLDARMPEFFAKGHLPGSINIGIDDNFASWVGALISDIEQEIIIIADLGTEEEVVTRLARVGYDNALGYLDGGFETWEDSDGEIDYVNIIEAEDFITLNKNSNLDVVDLRNENEYLASHIKNARNLPLGYINENMDEFKSEETIFLHCEQGYRAMIASSILKSRGVHNFVIVLDSYSNISNSEDN